MKLIQSNGRVLRVWAIEDVLYELRANGIPIKLHGMLILSDDEARAVVRELKKVQGCRSISS
jgi:hypothetical protein